MTRRYFSLALLTLAVAVVGGYAGWSQVKRAPQAACCPPCAAACCEAVRCPAATCVSAPPPCCPQCAPENAKLVDELLTILKETKSADTFLVAVKALSDIGPDAKKAVPAIIRGAEQHGLLKDIREQVKEEEGAGLMIMDAIEEILRGPEAACAPPPPRMAVYAQPVPFAAPWCPPPPMPPAFAVPPRSSEPARPASISTPPTEEEKR
jgi:hypothetical protein